MEKTSSSKWTFLTSHGLVLVHVMQHSNDTVRAIADHLGLAERTVAGILSDLKAHGYITVTKVGRKNAYNVQTGMPMRHFSQAGHTIAEVLGVLAAPAPIETTAS